MIDHPPNPTPPHLLLRIITRTYLQGSPAPPYRFKLAGYLLHLTTLRSSLAVSLQVLLVSVRRP
jgi:hypothetical protein